MRIGFRRTPFIKLFLLLSMAVFFIGSLFSYAYGKEKMDFIRVGLTKEFLEKPQLKIRNKEIKIGFSKKDRFYLVDVFRSEEGFVVSRGKERLQALAGEYEGYEEVLQELKEEDGEVAVLTGFGEKGGRWKRYVAGSEEKREESPKQEFLEISFGEKAFFVDIRTAGGYPQFVAANRNGERLINLEGKNYRGRMEIGGYERAGVTAVNVVRVDDYVRGVIPLEVGYSWHMAALKAQAVCARSFAVATAGFRADSDMKRGYRLNNTIHQSYGGYDVEGERPSQAVRETLGELLTYRNRVVRAFYYSSSGGATESSENVWGKKVEHIRSVPDIYENKPGKAPWTISFSNEEIKERLEAKEREEGKILGEIREIVEEDYSKSGRVLSLRVVGDLGSMDLKKQEIREVFSLPSTKFEVFQYGDVASLANILYQKKDGSYKKGVKLTGRTVVYGNGKKKRLESVEENGRQIMSLAGQNRKGYYLGEMEEGRFYFVGSGFGHGVGMSQSGARGMAEAGYGYKRILLHYFRGAEVN